MPPGGTIETQSDAETTAEFKLKLVFDDAHFPEFTSDFLESFLKITT